MVGFHQKITSEKFGLVGRDGRMWSEKKTIETQPLTLYRQTDQDTIMVAPQMHISFHPCFYASNFITDATIVAEYQAAVGVSAYTLSLYEILSFLLLKRLVLKNDSWDKPKPHSNSSSCSSPHPHIPHPPSRSYQRP